VSRINTPAGKRVRRIERRDRWRRARCGVDRLGRKIRTLCIYVSKRAIKAQRYLREHGLPHSAAVAAVMIEPTVKLPPKTIAVLASLVGVAAGLDLPWRAT